MLETEPRGKQGADNRRASQEARNFLLANLAGGERLAEELYQDARGQGIAERTLRRAKGQLGIRDRRVGTRWLWRLGDHAPDPSERASRPTGQVDPSAPASQPQVPQEDPVYETARGRLYEGDCIEVMRALPPESVDLVFADPPFNLGKKYASGIDDSLSESEYLAWCHLWLEEAIRLLRDGGSLFLYNLPRWNLLLAGYLAQKLTFRHWIAVDMKASMPISGRLYPAHYSLLYFVKGKKPATFHPDRLPIAGCRHCGRDVKDYGGHKKTLNPMGLNMTDMWTDISPVRHKRYKTRRANELPLKLLDRVISMASNPGDVVLDPFGGSGTTYTVAELTGRRWVGAELDCSDIKSRLENLEPDRLHLAELHAAKNVLELERRRKKAPSPPMSRPLMWRSSSEIGRRILLASMFPF